jgi:hypothetical protein
MFEFPGNSVLVAFCFVKSQKGHNRVGIYFLFFCVGGVKKIEGSVETNP